VARPIWSGAINFGLVTIPVELYSATEDHTISFRQFERGTSDRIRYKRINERTGKEVAFSDIVKGADLGGGEYVIIEPDELDAIAPGRSRTIDINTFVVAFVLTAASGVMSAAFGVFQTTLLLMTTDESLHGRALGVQELAIGIMPVASLALGAFAEHYGVGRTTFVSALLLVVLVAALAIWTPSLLRYSGSGYGD